MDAAFCGAAWAPGLRAPGARGAAAGVGARGARCCVRPARRAVLRAGAAAALAAALGAPGGAGALSKKRILAKAGPEVELESGIAYREITVGKGLEPRYGDTVAIHYSLYYDDLEGLTLGIEGMKVGGLRLISVPAKYGYGDKGHKPFVPPNADIDFAVSLLSCKRKGTNPNSMIDSKSQVF